jgi:hypothetical protein
LGNDLSNDITIIQIYLEAQELKASSYEFSEISGSHGDEYEVDSLLGYGTV